MDFLKRHYEKLVLALALIVLIGAATYLVRELGKLDREIRNTPAHAVPKSKIPPLRDKHYKDALAALRNPAVWTNTANSMFVPYEPPIIVPTSTVETIRTSVVKIITLQRIVRVPFGLLFKAYRWDEETKTASQFQINLRTKAVSVFVEKVGEPVADRFEKTDFRAIHFERKTELVEVPGLPAKRENDVSELTVQKEGGKPVVLILNQVAAPDPVAHLQCGVDGPTRQLKADETFDCFGRTYKVVDIGANQVIILDTKTGEKQTIRLAP